MNSFIPWVGGKSKLLWIINKMAPDHYSRFIDVFGGSGTVTMSRPIQPGCMEVYNDFNGNLTNLFCCVKNRTLALLSELGFLPLNTRDDFNVLYKFFSRGEFTDDYLQEEMNLTEVYLKPPDAEAIRAAHLRVVVDPMGGAAQGYLADLLRELGVEVHEIHAGQASDQEDICPDPVEPWVDACERTVIEDGACAGLVTDGDADRIGAVDERGRYIHPHQIMALVLGDLVQFRNLEGRVVVNLSCSTLVRRIAEALGCRVTVKPVGFKYIAAEMKKGGVLIGGEEAGGIGIAAHMPERDGILACLILCELMAKTDAPLGVLVDQLEDSFGKTSYGRRDLRLEAEDAETLRTLLPGVNPKSICGKVPQNVSHMDGLRLAFEDDTWLLVRPSGTEPVVRVYAEGFSVEERDELLDAGCALARGTYPL